MSVELKPPGRLQTEQLADGRRRLLRDLVLEIDGRVLTIPQGTITDYSSWPRWLPGPRWSRIDTAGVCHDYLFQTGVWGGKPVTYREANRIWYTVARAGSDPKARAGAFSAWMGRIGLFLFSWPVWLRYRRA